MVKRILDCARSDFEKMSSRDLFESIKASEGRTLLAEIYGPSPPLVWGVSNPEIAVAFGADLIMLNGYDVNNPVIVGVPTEKEPFEIPGIGKLVGFGATVNDVKKLIGRPVGINLEAIDPSAKVIGERTKVPKGRLALPENARKAIEQGVDFIRIGGNPETGATTKMIAESVKMIKKEIGDEILLFAGKEHSAGVPEEAGRNALSIKAAEEYIANGADVVLVPSAGTLPGQTFDYVVKVIDTIHDHGALAMTVIGTSQEGSDFDTIKRIAFYNKMAGADILQIGDACFSGIAFPENIMAFSIVIRGRRHTYRRMAISLAR
ncbi:MAG: DUF7916 family protein [Candidatus Asgardarchaeia archaeon]